MHVIYWLILMLGISIVGMGLAFADTFMRNEISMKILNFFKKDTTMSSVNQATKVQGKDIYRF